MAMPRRTGVRPIQLFPSKYQDFEPKSEWKEDDEAHLLLLHLPGFLKEQVRITYVHSSQIIRIHGERPIAKSKWSRFNQPFHLPVNCVYDRIHGSFQSGILTVTIPKQTGAKPTSTFPEKERRPPEKMEEVSPKLPTSISEDENQMRRKEASSSTLEENLPEQKPNVPEKIAIPEKRTETREKVESDAEHNPETEEEERFSDPEEQLQLKTKKEEKESPKEPEIPDKTMERTPGKMMESTEEKVTANKDKAVETLKIRSKRLKEEEEGEEADRKQMLINMGAALLLIVAIGAYTAINFTSYPESKN